MKNNPHKAWLEEVQVVSSTRLSRSLGAFELAPLVDVILMLVIFSLMVTGIIYTPGIQVDLPAVSESNIIRGRTLKLTVTKTEQVFINDDAAPVIIDEAILSYLNEYKKYHPEGTVLIKADYNVRHGYLMKLMELVRNSGLQKIAFETAPSTKK